MQPLYEMNDALGVLEHFEGYYYDEVVEVNDEVSVRFTDIGHLLGSASIEIWIDVYKRQSQYPGTPADGGRSGGSHRLYGTGCRD